MRRRNILLLCAQRVVQDLIARQLRAEFSDLLIVRSENMEHSLSLLQDHHFDMVIACTRVVSKPLIEVLDLDQTTAVLLKRGRREPVCSSLREYNLQPISMDENWSYLLFELLRTRCHPKRFRSEPRYHVPELKAELTVYHFTIPAEVVNINSMAFLADVDYRPEHAALLNGVQASLVFPAHYPHPELGPCSSRILKAHVLESEDYGIPRKLRIVVLLTGLSERQSLRISENLRLAAQECESGNVEVAG